MYSYLWTISCDFLYATSVPISFTPTQHHMSFATPTELLFISLFFALNTFCEVSSSFNLNFNISEFTNKENINVSACFYLDNWKFALHIQTIKYQNNLNNLMSKVFIRESRHWRFDNMTFTFRQYYNTGKTIWNLKKENKLRLITFKDCLFSWVWDLLRPVAYIRLLMMVSTDEIETFSWNMSNRPQPNSLRTFTSIQRL